MFTYQQHKDGFAIVDPQGRILATTDKRNVAAQHVSALNNMTYSVRKGVAS